MYFPHIFEYGTLKPVETILRKGRREREDKGGNEPIQGISYACMEIS
jgi:hypothetical protein